MDITEVSNLLDEVADYAYVFPRLHDYCTGWRRDADSNTQNKTVPIESASSIEYIQELVNRGRLRGQADRFDLRCIVRLSDISTVVEFLIVPRGEV